MDTVFDVFTQQPYTFLTIQRGNVYGNQITSERELVGIFKLKSRMVMADNMEVATSDARLHAHPEDFPGQSAAELVGQGIRVNGEEYTIEHMSAGTNFDTGVVEHLTFYLKRSNFVKANNAR